MRALLCLALLGLLAPAALAGLPPKPELRLVGNEVDVSIIGGFNPPVVVIPVGGSVTWVVHENLVHTVTGILGTPPDSGPLPDTGHAEYTATFTEQGVVPYHCLVYPFMVGVVVVVG
jgi:plastocyanin